MIDRDLLIGACYRKHLRLGDVANQLGLTQGSLSRRITAGAFSREEIDVIAKYLKLSNKERDEIFFAK